MELWDAYDVSFKKIKDKTLIRGEKIPQGFYHLVCDVLVKHIDGTYLLMKRDLRKTFGGMWEATAGGSALIGESPLQCAFRELKEETGIIADILTQVGIVKDKDTIYVEFLCITDWNKESIVMQDGETIDFKWVSRDELLSMKKDNLITERMQNFLEELR